MTRRGKLAFAALALGLPALGAAFYVVRGELRERAWSDATRPLDPKERAQLEAAVDDARARLRERSLVLQTALRLAPTEATKDPCAATPTGDVGWVTIEPGAPPTALEPFFERPGWSGSKELALVAKTMAWKADPVATMKEGLARASKVGGPLVTQVVLVEDVLAPPRVRAGAVEGGLVQGRAFLFDGPSQRFVCMRRFHAESSPELTSAKGSATSADEQTVMRDFEARFRAAQARDPERPWLSLGVPGR